MSIITDWLMVIITTVYVVATIFICVFNSKTAKSASLQIEEMKKQQKQNVGIQLYNKRKEIFEKVSVDKFNDVFWDVPLLFNTEINDEFITVANLKNSLDEQNKKICAYIDLYKESFDKDAYNELLQLFDLKDRSLFTYNESNEIYKLTDKFNPIYTDPETNEKVLLKFKDVDKKSRETQVKLGIAKTNLLLKIQDYIKDSLK